VNFLFSLSPSSPLLLFSLESSLPSFPCRRRGAARPDEKWRKGKGLNRLSFPPPPFPDPSHPFFLAPRKGDRDRVRVVRLVGLLLLSLFLFPFPFLCYFFLPPSLATALQNRGRKRGIKERMEAGAVTSLSPPPPFCVDPLFSPCQQAGCTRPTREQRCASVPSPPCGPS